MLYINLLVGGEETYQELYELIWETNEELNGATLFIF